MTILKAALIGLCAVVGGGAALAAPPSDFAATDAKLQACEARDSSNAHMEACLSIAQATADARLNALYQDWTGALKHPDPSDAKDDAEILKRLVAAERAWIAFRDADCDLQSISALGGTEEALAFSVCRYAMTKARVAALDTARKSR